MLAEEAEPQPPQRVGAGQHHLHQPPGVGGAVEAQGELEHVLEIIGQHRLAALMGELVGVERDERAADDEEQPEAHPGGDERRQSRPVERAAGALRAGQRIDDAAEQHRLGERRGGERDIGERQQPAEPHLRAEQAEHAGVEAEHGVRRGRLEPRLRGPGAHARRPVGLRIDAAVAPALRSRPWRRARSRNRCSSRRGGAGGCTHRDRSAAARA